MSLTVSPALVDQANSGDIDDVDFLQCVQASLPYAWSVVVGSIEKLHAEGARVVINEDVPPTEAEWGQLFRLVASDAMRNAVEQHYGVKVAFQNCCKVGVFAPTATAEYAEFTSTRAQILNQKPELLNC